MAALSTAPARVSLLGQAFALNDLGEVQRETGDYLAAEASHQQATFRELGNRLGQAEMLNQLGELSSRTSATGQARDRHSRALAMARELAVPFEEARALHGLGQACLLYGNRDEAASHLAHALRTYRRIGAHAAQRVQDLIRANGLETWAPQP